MMGRILSKLEYNENEDEEKSIRKPEVDEELSYRVFAVLCYFFVLVVIGFPVWWYTTRVYRAPLPLDSMNIIDIPENTEKNLGIPLNLEYDLLVTFVNPDPQNLKIDLNGEDIEDTLKLHLEQLESVANFTIKSQWLYLVQLGVTPRKVNDYYVLNEEQLPHIISPLEKTLWAHVTPRAHINLVIYFAPCSLPLYIVDKQEQLLLSNAFISPGWGGILLDNADKESCIQKSYKPNIENILPTCVTQIYNLFNLDKELVDFQTRKTNEMIYSSQRTLKSLNKLLSEIPSIVINDEVAEKVNIAVESVEKASKFIKEGNTKDALEYAKVAYKNSEDAFKDPSLLALLYFPDDQKYAVYIPLFLPVMIPVLMSLFTVRKWYVNRKKEGASLLGRTHY